MSKTRARPAHPLAFNGFAGARSPGERPACGRAQLLAKRGPTGQMQTPAEFVPIPEKFVFFNLYIQHRKFHFINCIPLNPVVDCKNAVAVPKIDCHGGKRIFRTPSLDL